MQAHGIASPGSCKGKISKVRSQPSNCQRTKYNGSHSTPLVLKMYSFCTHSHPTTIRLRRIPENCDFFRKSVLQENRRTPILICVSTWYSVVEIGRKSANAPILTILYSSWEASCHVAAWRHEDAQTEWSWPQKTRHDAKKLVEVGTASLSWGEN